jgi:hypothetical protein
MDILLQPKKTTKVIFLYWLIIGLFHGFSAFGVNENLKEYINNGLFDEVEFHRDLEKVYFSDSGINLYTYDSYAEALDFGDKNRVLFSQDGLSYKAERVLGEVNYVIDFTWLPKGIYNNKDIKDYINKHPIMMLIRTMYLSNGGYIGILYFPLLYFISMMIFPFILLTISRVYGWFYLKDSKKELINKETSLIARSIYLDLIIKRWNRNYELEVLTGIFSFFISREVGFNIIPESDFKFYISLYLALLLVVGIYYAVIEYKIIDKKRLERERRKLDV